MGRAGPCGCGGRLASGVGAGSVPGMAGLGQPQDWGWRRRGRPEHDRAGRRCGNTPMC